MKRGIFVLVFIILISLSSVYALSFSDVSGFFNKILKDFGITGKQVYGGSAGCGNGVLDTGEECDDAMSAQELDMVCSGGTSKGWSCSSDCLECISSSPETTSTTLPAISYGEYQPYTYIDESGLVYTSFPLDRKIVTAPGENIIVSSFPDGRKITANGKFIDDFDGYIVEFKDDPVLVYKNKIEKGIISSSSYQAVCGDGFCDFGANEVGIGCEECHWSQYKGCCIDGRYYSLDEWSSDMCPPAGGVGTNQEVVCPSNNIDLRSYKQNLKQKQNDFINYLQSSFPQHSLTTSKTTTADIEIMNQFTDVFNGLSIDASQDVIEEIKKNPEVKRVTLNRKVYTTLMDSVPLINADDVWLLDVDGNQCATTGKECLTGKGVTIGIIDTGVDYTHEDLGESNIDDGRIYDKITPQPIIPYFPITPWVYDRQIFMEDNKLLYYSGDKLYLYSFETANTLEINTPSEIKTIVTLSFKDNIIAYFASTQDLVTALYYYNLNTGTSTKITQDYTAINVGSLFIENEKIIYSLAYNQNNEFFSGIYIYDINTKETNIVGEDPEYILLPRVSNGKIAYSVTTGYCYDKIVLYDMNTNTQREVIPPDVGPVLDFEDDKILYIDCSKTDFDRQWRHYHLYNTNTEQSIPLFYSEDGNGSSENNILNSRGVYGWIGKGAIGDGIIFFSKDVNANMIIAYDQNLGKYVEINLARVSGAIDAEGEKVCFLSNDLNIYCHDYDSEYSYPESFVNLFNSKVVGGYDFVNNDNDPIDDHGHGTHVAATAAGNGILNGVAPEASIYAYKVLSSGGWGYWDWVIGGIERSIDPNNDGDYSDHLDVISLSLGGGGNPDDPVSSAIDNAVDNGVIAVIAAGNSGPAEETIGSPGTARKAITVGASDKNKFLAEFSSRGPVIWTDVNGQEQAIIKPDVVAPGVDICAAQWGSAWSDRKCLDDKHIAISGTSMATPHVSGLVALIKQRNPNYVPEEIKSVIKNTANLLPEPEKIINQGFGHINAIDSVFFNNPMYVELDPIEQDKMLIDIKGMISGDNFDHYTLAYTLNKPFLELNEDDWVDITIAHQIPENRILYSNLNLLNVPDGDLLIRLRAIDDFGIAFDDYGFIKVRKFPFVEPLWNDILNPKNDISVKIDNPGNFDVDSFLLDYSVNGKEWSSVGIMQNPSGLEGTITRNAISESGFLDIRATIVHDGFSDNSIIRVYIDNSLREGWPQRIKWEKDTFGNYIMPSFYMDPVSADLDNDGDLEVIILASGSGGRLNIYVYNELGNAEDGWPVEIIDEGGFSNYNVRGASIGDVDNDGLKEILFIGTTKYLYIYNHDGYLYKQINLEEMGSYHVNSLSQYTEPVIFDLDGDGKKEIIITFYAVEAEPNKIGFKLAVLNNEGLPLSGWPQYYYDSINPDGSFFVCDNFGLGLTSAIGNFDVDPEFEMVVLSPKNNIYGNNYCEGRVYIFNLDGSVLNGFPLDFAETITRSPVTGDIDNDGFQEITFVSYDVGNGEYILRILDRSGNVLLSLVKPNSISQLSLIDYLGDGNLEILFNSGGASWIYNLQGDIIKYTPYSSLSGLPVIVKNILLGGTEKEYIYSYSNDYYSPTAGSIVSFDIGNDELNKHLIEWSYRKNAPIAFDNTNSIYQVIASSSYDYDLENSLPKYRSSLYVWEFNDNNALYSSDWPMFQHDPQHTGCYDCEKKPQCQDDMDNDNDGLIDMNDPGCESSLDNDENNCRNNICESGENDYCPPCIYESPPCRLPCTAGTCSIDCVMCNNGIIEPQYGEECDSGSGCLSGWTCTQDCKCIGGSICGNGICEDRERIVGDCLIDCTECNDRVDNDNDGFCDLLSSTCSDGSVSGDPDCESIEDNDETKVIISTTSTSTSTTSTSSTSSTTIGPTTTTSSSSTTSTTIPITSTNCGNGILNTGEECDDGNLVSGDGCNSECLVERCGNNKIETYTLCIDPPWWAFWMEPSCTTTIEVCDPPYSRRGCITYDGYKGSQLCSSDCKNYDPVCRNEEWCGDGKCNGPETSNTCTNDCGAPAGECVTDFDCRMKYSASSVCVSGVCRYL